VCRWCALFPSAPSSPSSRNTPRIHPSPHPFLALSGPAPGTAPCTAPGRGELLALDSALCWGRGLRLHFQSPVQQQCLWGVRPLPWGSLPFLSLVPVACAAGPAVGPASLAPDASASLAPDSSASLACTLLCASPCSAWCTGAAPRPGAASGASAPPLRSNAAGQGAASGTPELVAWAVSAPAGAAPRACGGPELGGGQHSGALLSVLVLECPGPLCHPPSQAPKLRQLATAGAAPHWAHLQCPRHLLLHALFWGRHCCQPGCHGQPVQQGACTPPRDAQ